MASSTPSSARRAWSLALALALTAQGAAAAPRKASLAAQARAAALEGKKAYDTGDYPAALQRYQEAYRLKPAPGLLFNLGQCQRKLGQLDEALSLYRRYLETGPAPTQARATEQLVKQLEAEKEARAAQAAADAARRKADEEEATRIRLESLRLTTERAQNEAASRRLELELATQAVAPAPPPPVTSQWWFWTGIGVAVAGGTVAAFVATAPRAVQTSLPDINAR